MVLTNSSGEGEQNISSPPVSPSNRIESLDVLRGIAVLGALFVSIWIFGGFSTNQQNNYLLNSKGWNHRVLGTIELLFNGKMRALIALVFGAAMIVFLYKESVPDRQPQAEIFIKRQLWLILFGLLNALVFLWTHDILFHLGIMGILLFPFVGLSSRGLLIAAVLTTFIYSGKYYWNYSDKKTTYNKFLVVTALEKKYIKDSTTKAGKGIIKAKDTLTKHQKDEKQAWEGVLAGMKVDLKKDEGVRKTMHDGKYGKIWNHLLPTAQTREAQWTYRFGIWDFAGMMFLGMAFYKIGFFRNSYPPNKYLIFSLVSLFGGLLFGWYRLHHHQIALQDFTKYINHFLLPHDFFFPLERAFIALGYAGLVIYILALGFLLPVWRALKCVGQLALTNYLLQSLICTIFFYGYGMGYYGRLSQIQLYCIVIEIILIQIIFSVMWLRFYNYGPAEWLLRKLSYKLYPKTMRKLPETETILPVLS